MQLQEAQDDWSVDTFYTNYASDPDNAIRNIMPNTTIERLLSLCGNMIHQMLNDKNSGFLRERVTLNLLGLEQNMSKNGYDSTSGNYEVKPTNISKSGKRKLNGHGNITDHRWERHEKFLNDNMKLLLSGWVDGCIIYIVEVDYKDIRTHMESQLSKHLPNGDEKNRYVRSASVSHTHYQQALKVRWVSHHLKEYKFFVAKNLYNCLFAFHESRVHHKNEN